MEEVCLSSFVHHGHEVHLYSYSEIENVPEGVEKKDGREILPEDMIFEYKHHKSFSGFSNYFRYKLLSEKGGWWTDTDVVCLKPFDFDSNYVFCSEEVPPFGQGNTHIGSCIIKASQDNPVTADAFKTCMSKKPEDLVWGEIGPRLVKAMVEKYNMSFSVKPPETFCPVPGCHWFFFLDPKSKLSFGEDTYAVHLWNEMWRRSDVDKSAQFHPNCFYEQAKRKYIK